MTKYEYEIKEALTKFENAVDDKAAERIATLWDFPCEVRSKDGVTWYKNQAQMQSGLELLRQNCNRRGIKRLQKRFKQIYRTSGDEVLVRSEDRAFDDNEDMVSYWFSTYLMRRDDAGWKISKADLRNQEAALTELDVPFQATLEVSFS